MNWQLMSALARLERFGEKDPLFTSQGLQLAQQSYQPHYYLCKSVKNRDTGSLFLRTMKSHDDYWGETKREKSAAKWAGLAVSSCLCLKKPLLVFYSYIFLQSLHQIGMKNITNVWCIKFRNKHSSNTVLCLLQNLMHQTLWLCWKNFLVFNGTINIPIYFRKMLWKN